MHSKVLERNKNIFNTHCNRNGIVYSIQKFAKGSKFPPVGGKSIYLNRPGIGLYIHIRFGKTQSQSQSFLPIGTIYHLERPCLYTHTYIYIYQIHTRIYTYLIRKFVSQSFPQLIQFTIWKDHVYIHISIYTYIYIQLGNSQSQSFRQLIQSTN